MNEAMTWANIIVDVICEAEPAGIRKYRNTCGRNQDIFIFILLWVLGGRDTFDPA